MSTAPLPHPHRPPATFLERSCDLIDRINEWAGLFWGFTIIAVTAGAMVERRRRALDAGRQGFLPKPLDPAQMIGMLRRVVEAAGGAALPVKGLDSNAPQAGSPWPLMHGIDTADVARDWYRGPNALRGEINSLDHKLREILEQNAALHEQHRAYDFEVFHPKFAPVLYWVLLGLAAVLETPLNNSALGLLQMDDLQERLVGQAGLVHSARLLKAVQRRRRRLNRRRRAVATILKVLRDAPESGERAV